MKFISLCISYWAVLAVPDSDDEALLQLTHASSHGCKGGQKKCVPSSPPTCDQYPCGKKWKWQPMKNPGVCPDSGCKKRDCCSRSPTCEEYQSDQQCDPQGKGKWQAKKTKPTSCAKKCVRKECCKKTTTTTTTTTTIYTYGICKNFAKKICVGSWNTDTMKSKETCANSACTQIECCILAVDMDYCRVWGDPHIHTFFAGKDDSTFVKGSQKNRQSTFNGTHIKGTKNYEKGDWTLYEEGEKLTVQGRMKPLIVNCDTHDLTMDVDGRNIYPPASMVAVAINGTHTCNKVISVTLDNIGITDKDGLVEIEYGENYEVKDCFAITRVANNDFILSFAHTDVTLLVYEEKKTRNRLALEIVKPKSLKAEDIGGLCDGENLFDDTWKVGKDTVLFATPSPPDTGDSPWQECKGATFEQAVKYCVDEGFNNTEWLREQHVFNSCVIDKCACLDDTTDFLEEAQKLERKE